MFAVTATIAQIAAATTVTLPATVAAVAVPAVAAVAPAPAPALAPAAEEPAVAVVASPPVTFAPEDVLDELALEPVLLLPPSDVDELLDDELEPESELDWVLLLLLLKFWPSLTAWLLSEVWANPLSSWMLNCSAGAAWVSPVVKYS